MSSSSEVSLPLVAKTKIEATLKAGVSARLASTMTEKQKLSATVPPGSKETIRLTFRRPQRSSDQIFRVAGNEVSIPCTIRYPVSYQMSVV